MGEHHSQSPSTAKPFSWHYSGLSHLLILSSPPGETRERQVAIAGPAKRHYLIVCCRTWRVVLPEGSGHRGRIHSRFAAPPRG